FAFRKIVGSKCSTRAELLEKLEESIENLEKQSSPVEELSHILKRADNFLYFVLQNAPVVIGHQACSIDLKLALIVLTSCNDIWNGRCAVVVQHLVLLEP
ncbi:hypothetical protein Tco_1472277, partial [Tanacetum coccineum]